MNALPDGGAAAAPATAPPRSRPQHRGRHPLLDRRPEAVVADQVARRQRDGDGQPEPDVRHRASPAASGRTSATARRPPTPANSARKKTQPTSTHTIVSPQPQAVPAQDVARAPIRRGLRRSQAARKTAVDDQEQPVQHAPDDERPAPPRATGPPSVIVISRLRPSSHSPPRLPPSGMNR